ILRVPALESAVRYYRDVLGLPLVRHDARLASFRLADGGAELVLHTDPDLPAEAVYYLVDDVRDLYRRRAELKLTFVSAPPQPTRQEVWRHLLNLRKGGKLPKLGEAKSPAPPVTPESREQLREMLGEDIGKRDRLPYTPRFEQLVDEFNKTQPRRLSPHLVW